MTGRFGRSGGGGGGDRSWSTTVIVLASLGVVVAAVLVFWAIPVLLTRHPAVHGAERHTAMGEVRTALLTMLGASGAVVGIAYTARSYRLSQVAHLTGRFQDAAKLMAESDHMAKLGGIEAMAQLADEWPDERQRCIDMLCAHIRHAVTVDGERPDPMDHEADTRRRVIELIRDSVVDGSSKSWQGCHFDLRRTILGGFDLKDLAISSVSFDFSGSTFVPGDDHALVDLSGSTLRDVVLRFDEAKFRPGAGVDLRGTTLRSSTVSFEQAQANNGVVSFASSTIDAGSSVSLARLTANDGTITFADATVDGTLTFEGADLSEDVGTGAVSFDRAAIATVVSFDRGAIDRRVTFRDADLRRGGISACTREPPAVRIVLDGARCEGATLICEEPGRPIEFDLGAAVGTPAIVAPAAAEPVASGAEPPIGR